MKKYTSILIASTLILGAASAQNNSIQGDLKTSTVVLVDSKGNTVGTYDSNGKLTVKGDLKLASKVVVTSKTGSKQEFQLSSQVNSTTQLQALKVNYNNSSTALVSLFAKSNTAGSGNVSGNTSASGSSSNNSASGSVAGSAGAGGSTSSGSASGGLNLNIGVGGSAGGGSGSGSGNVGIGIGIGGGLDLNP